MMFSSLQNFSVHKAVFALALPMVLSNITVPLLGLVDAAVIGNLQHAWYLGGVALGSSFISVLFWLLGFLRMSTTGVTAQAWGANNQQALVHTLLQGLLLAVSFSMLILLAHAPIVASIVDFSDASEQVQHYAQQYIGIRIWGAPAALINLVMMGWLLGIQNAKQPMLMIIAINLLNIVLDLLLVVVFDFKVQGVASATLIAEYCGMLLGCYFVLGNLRKQGFSAGIISWRKVRNGLLRLMALNRDIFLRSLCLQATFVFMTFHAASLGDAVVAANVVLMNFLFLISFAMDGFAYAMEAMVGKAIGAKDREQLSGSLLVTGFWSLMITLMITMLFALFGQEMINLITSLAKVRVQAYTYLPWLIALPLVAMWCFLLDGIFVGATQVIAMRNTMFVAMLSFFMVWLVGQQLFNQTNHALWAAMTVFMLVRGLALGFVFVRRWRRGEFIQT